MFAVRPVKDREYQKKLCEALGAAYIETSLAYYAADLADDRESVSKIIGICQFTVGEKAEILTLVPAEGRLDDEAVIIMCRAVMNFVYRLGIPILVMKKDAGPAEMLEKTGIPMSDGEYEIDLTEFYKEPCKYSKTKSGDNRNEN